MFLSRCFLVPALLLSLCAGCSSVTQSSDAGADRASDSLQNSDAVANVDSPTAMDAVTGVDVPPPMDVSVLDAATPCTDGASCGTGQICVFAAAGCSQVGVCAIDIGCGRPSLPYCGCTGMTFFDHCAGPAERWVSMGPCPVDGGVVSDAPATDATSVDSGGDPCITGGFPCGVGLTCCGATCMNLANDPLNCGTCGTRCTAATPMCQAGVCATATCAPTCGAGQSCCEVNRGGPSTGPSCYNGPTCPVGCPACD